LDDDDDDDDDEEEEEEEEEEAPLPDFACLVKITSIRLEV
jgi:hypothetical protein